jgi:uncharacterized membrane protein
VGIAAAVELAATGDPEYSMKPRHFIEAIDHNKIVAAIREAETHTSGQIRVFVSHQKTHDALRSARQSFAKLKMNQTALHNAVLIFVAPVSHQFAVVGDTGVHLKCGEEFWRAVIAAMEQGMKQGDFTGALIHGVEKVGSVLAAHFPPDPEKKDDLSDAVFEG